MGPIQPGRDFPYHSKSLALIFHPTPGPPSVAGGDGCQKTSLHINIKRITADSLATGLRFDKNRGNSNMKNPIQTKSCLLQTFKPLACALAASLLCLASSRLIAGGNEGNPGIAPPHSRSHGKTYGEWSAAWWTWALQLPVAGPPTHPFIDDPSFDVTEGQSGDVWFLAAPFGTVER